MGIWSWWLEPKQRCWVIRWQVDDVQQEAWGPENFRELRVTLATLLFHPRLSVKEKQISELFNTLITVKSSLSTCTPMFAAALFTIARTRKQPRCPSAVEWMRKLWYIYTMEYYSAIKNNSFESVLMRWMKLEPIIQSEVSQKEKHQYSILMHTYGI